MNLEDSKTLEHVEKRWHDASPNDVVWLIHRLKKQDREIERLENSRGEMNAQVSRWGKLYDYERRHREWALKQCRTWQRYFCFYKDDAVRFHSDRADKAEAELVDARKVYEAHGTEAERQIDELQARVKELEDERKACMDLRKEEKV